MKYWRLYQSAEKEVGFVPQIVEPIFNGNYNDPNQLWNNMFNKLDNNFIEIPKAHLHKRAKFTDLLSADFTSDNLFISNRLKDILDHHKKIGVQFFKSEIFDKKGMSIEVYIMHPFKVNESFIDLDETIFQVRNMFGKVLLDEMKIKSLEEYHLKKATLINENKTIEDNEVHKYLTISKIAFKKDSSFTMCSVFDIHYGGIGWYVSETLKQELLNAKCTGMIFRDLDERYP